MSAEPNPRRPFLLKYGFLKVTVLIATKITWACAEPAKLMNRCISLCSKFEIVQPSTKMHNRSTVDQTYEDK
jgi:hypothetical protein